MLEDATWMPRSRMLRLPALECLGWTNRWCCRWRWSCRWRWRLLPARASLSLLARFERRPCPASQRHPVHHRARTAKSPKRQSRAHAILQPRDVANPLPRREKRLHVEPQRGADGSAQHDRDGQAGSRASRSRRGARHCSWLIRPHCAGGVGIQRSCLSVVFSHETLPPRREIPPIALFGPPAQRHLHRAAELPPRASPRSPASTRPLRALLST